MHRYRAPLLMELPRTNCIWYEYIPLEVPRTLIHQHQITSFSLVPTGTNNNSTFILP